MLVYLGGNPGIGKSTLGDRLEKTGRYKHLDLDTELSKISRNKEKLKKVTFLQMPIFDRPKDDYEYNQWGLAGKLTHYVHLGISQVVLDKAIKIIDTTGKHVVITGCFSNIISRKVILNGLNKAGIGSNMVYLYGTPDELILEAKKRAGKIMRQNINYASEDEVRQAIQGEQLPEQENEGWDKIVLLQREDIISSIKSIPELQFLFQ